MNKGLLFTAPFVCRIASGSKANDSRPDSGRHVALTVRATAKFRYSMQRQDEREIREELVKLRLEHRELDSEIAMMEASSAVDQLHLTRLKRRKLKLKDQITSLEDRLFPDIIA